MLTRCRSQRRIARLAEGVEWARLAPLSFPGDEPSPIEAIQTVTRKKPVSPPPDLGGVGLRCPMLRYRASLRNEDAP